MEVKFDTKTIIIQRDHLLEFWGDKDAPPWRSFRIWIHFEPILTIPNQSEKKIFISFLENRLKINSTLFEFIPINPNQIFNPNESVSIPEFYPNEYEFNFQSKGIRINRRFQSEWIRIIFSIRMNQNESKANNSKSIFECELIRMNPKLLFEWIRIQFSIRMTLDQFWTYDSKSIFECELIRINSRLLSEWIQIYFFIGRN